MTVTVTLTDAQVERLTDALVNTFFLVAEVEELLNLLNPDREREQAERDARARERAWDGGPLAGAANRLMDHLG